MRRKLREPSCERKDGMSFECRVIHPPIRDGTANKCSGHFCNVAASVAADESGNNGEQTKFLYLALHDFCT
jgi:hypothetical protein